MIYPLTEFFVAILNVFRREEMKMLNRIFD